MAEAVEGDLRGKVIDSLRRSGAVFALRYGSRVIYSTSSPASARRTGNSSKVCAVVDELRVQRLLRAITDDLSVLRIEATADAERRTDPLWLRGIKYTFVTAIEACSTSLNISVQPKGGGRLGTTATP